MLFSQRKGLKSVRSMVQKDDIDSALRSGLWDALHLHIWKNYQTSQIDFSQRFMKSNLYLLFQRYWHGYFNQPLDTVPLYFDEAHKIVRDYFFKCPWNEVYDFVEFTAKSAPENLTDEFVSFCNYVLEKELSAYRLVDKRIVEITSEEEIESIEEAIANTDKIKGIQVHLRTALSLLADKKKPDYRNSIKESISAVEAICQIITGDAKATLGTALKIFEEKAVIYPALKKSLSSLYGYTSDADGIRHAMLDESKLTFNDAKFMLVSCTAFINYLIGKASEEGIKI
jgi:hypothetical protein